MFAHDKSQGNIDCEQGQIVEREGDRQRPRHRDIPRSREKEPDKR